MDTTINRHPAGSAERLRSVREYEDELDAELNSNPVNSLLKILSNGRLIGREFCCGDVHNTPAKKGEPGSFQFNIRKLRGKDFNPTGGDHPYRGIFSVWVAHFGDRKTAREEAAKFLGSPEYVNPRPAAPRSGRGTHGRDNDDWTQVFPPPQERPDFKRLAWGNRRIALTSPYKSADGVTLFWVVRMEIDTVDPETGEIIDTKKEPRVVSWGHGPDGRRYWRIKGNGMNILFGLDELAKRPHAPVLVVEGEKTATLARTLFPDWVVVCWKGGAANVKNIDFTPLRGRVVYLLADADRDGGGRRAMEVAQQKALAAGAALTVRSDPPQACYDLKDGWDLADTMPDGWTVERMRGHIANGEAAKHPGPVAYYPAATMPAREARRKQGKLIQDFIEGEVEAVCALEKARKMADEEKARHENLTPSEKAKITRRCKLHVARLMGMESLRNGGRLLIVGSQGSGKTSDALKAVAKIGIPWLRVVFTLPTVDKCWEALSQYESLRKWNSLPGYVVLGRSAPEDKPDADGKRPTDTTMCRRHKVYNRLAVLNQSPRKNLCPDCPFKDVCGSLRQERELEEIGGGVFFMAREYLFIQLPIKGVHMLIGDESLPAVAASEPLYFDPKAILGAQDAHGRTLDESHALREILKKVHAAVMGEKEIVVEETADGEETKRKDEGRIIARLKTTEVSAADLRFAASRLDEAQASILQADIDGTMSDEAILAVLDSRTAMEFGSVARLCRQLAKEIPRRRDRANCVCLRHPIDRETGKPVDRVVVFHLKTPRISASAPVLLLDGTGSPWLNRVVFGKALEVERVPIQRSARVVGTIGRDFSRQSLTGTDRDGALMSAAKVAEAAKLRGDIAAFAAGLGQPVFACATMRAETALQAEFAATGADIATGHYAYVRGKNRWETYPVALLIGREEVTPWALEDMTRPFLADDDEPLIPLVDDKGRSCYVPQCRGRRMRDGTVENVVVMVHADPRCEEMHEQVREAELLQAVDRVRAIYNHRTFYLLNDLCLDVEYDAVMSWTDLKAGGDRFRIAYERTGNTVCLESPAELSRCFPDLWATRNAAKKAVEHAAGEVGVSEPIVYSESALDKLLGRRPQLLVEYQLDGQGQRSCRAWVQSEPAQARKVLEVVVGPVKRFIIDWAATVSLDALPKVPEPLHTAATEDRPDQQAAKHDDRQADDVPALPVPLAAAPAARSPLLVDGVPVAHIPQRGEIRSHPLPPAVGLRRQPPTKDETEAAVASVFAAYRSDFGDVMW